MSWGLRPNIYIYIYIGVQTDCAMWKISDCLADDTCFFKKSHDCIVNPTDPRF